MISPLPNPQDLREVGFLSDFSSPKMTAVLLYLPMAWLERRWSEVRTAARDRAAWRQTMEAFCATWHELDR